MQAVIMAGGKGTRLSAVTKNLIPKPMVPFCGKPLIERLIVWLVRNEVREIVVCIGCLGEQIKAYLSAREWGAALHFVEETEPLGTAGALAFAARYIREDFVLVYADLALDIDLGRMERFHREKEAMATLFVHPNSHPFDSDLVCCAPDSGRVNGFQWKGTARSADDENLVNAGVVLFSPAVFSYIASPQPLSLEKDLLNRLIQENEAVFAYRSPEYVKDVGTAERLAEAEEDFRQGAIGARNLKNRQKAIFLDRDGTLNAFGGLITSPDQLRLIPDAAEAVRRINGSGFLAIVVTNQPVIARGDCSLEELARIHRRLRALLGHEGAYLDDLFFCPHHPDKGFPGEIAQYKIDCACRKPKPGMLLSAADKYNINLSASWMIGDTLRDMQTGKNAGVKTALVRSAATETEGETNADLACESLLSAVKAILNSERTERTE